MHCLQTADTAANQNKRQSSTKFLTKVVGYLQSQCMRQTTIRCFSADCSQVCQYIYVCFLMCLCSQKLSLRVSGCQVPDIYVFGSSKRVPLEVINFFLQSYFENLPFNFHIILIYLCSSILKKKSSTESSTFESLVKNLCS